MQQKQEKRKNIKDFIANTALSIYLFYCVATLKLLYKNFNYKFLTRKGFIIIKK